MSLMDAYDESEEIVKAEMFTEGQKRLPEIAIVCFKTELIDFVENSKDFEEYSYALVCGEKIKIYKTEVAGKEVILYRTIMGGPATVGMMEELHSRGVQKFIIFGSCGELVQDLQKGAFIIPKEAYRDEGTSYHYVPNSDFIEVPTASKLAKIFDENNIKYELTKTWTTDAIYKETKNKLKDRVAKGCKVVDMECASIMAFASNRGLEAYQFLYTDDTLADENWNLKTMKDDRSFMLKECLKIAFKIIEKI